MTPLDEARQILAIADEHSTELIRNDYATVLALIAIARALIGIGEICERLERQLSDADR